MNVVSFLESEPMFRRYATPVTVLHTSFRISLGSLNLVPPVPACPVVQEGFNESHDLLAVPRSGYVEVQVTVAHMAVSNTSRHLVPQSLPHHHHCLG